ncbi:MAG: hypothetical protein JWM81_954 [Candidatus Saccharibacteria bacterium]|nr:hypothetical protein [Candidatus Saccharibacteria bacterium]
MRDVELLDLDFDPTSNGLSLSGEASVPTTETPIFDSVVADLGLLVLEGAQNA